MQNLLVLNTSGWVAHWLRSLPGCRSVLSNWVHRHQPWASRVQHVRPTNCIVHCTITAHRTRCSLYVLNLHGPKQSSQQLWRFPQVRKQFTLVKDSTLLSLQATSSQIYKFPISLFYILWMAFLMGMEKEEEKVQDISKIFQICKESCEQWKYGTILCLFFMLCPH